MKYNFYKSILFLLIIINIIYAIPKYPLFLIVNIILLINIYFWPSKIRDIIEPIYLYILVFTGLITSLLLFDLFLIDKIHYYPIQKSIFTDKALSFWLLSVIYFNIGYNFAKKVNKTVNIADFNASFKKIIVIFMYIIQLITLGNMIRYGIPLFVGSETKHDLGQGIGPLFNLIQSYAMLTMIVAVFLLLIDGKRKKYKKIVTGLLILSVLNVVFSTTRNLLVPLVLSVLIYWNYYRDSLTSKKFIIISTILFMAFMLIGLLRGSLGIKEGYRKQYVAERSVFIYFANQYEKLFHYYKIADEGLRNDDYPFGRFIFSGFWQILPERQYSDDLLFRKILYHSDSKAPTGVQFSAVLIYEGGWLFQIIGMLILGFITRKIYFFYINNKTVFMGYVSYVYWLYLLIIKTIYANLFSRAVTIVVLSTIILINLPLMKKKVIN